MMRVNLKGVYTTTHFCAPHAQKSGRIVTIGSGAAQRGSALRSHYSATKGGIISFTRSLAMELAPHNILVNCIAPGFVRTDMTAEYFATKQGLKFATGLSFLKRIGSPEEIAGPVLFAVSDLATYITGQVINVNGGSIG